MEFLAMEIYERKASFQNYKIKDDLASHRFVIIDR